MLNLFGIKFYGKFITVSISKDASGNSAVVKE